MVQIVVILLVNFILVPLIGLTLSERVKFFVLVGVYLITFLWIVYTLWTGKEPM